MEKVSVIIPCFNSGSTINKTINSLRNQTWKNLEIIVIDDGSNDQYTIKVIKNLKDIKLITQLNKGLPNARNVGIENSTGKFFIPLDADDWLENDAIERLLEALKKNKNASYAYSFLSLEGELNGTLKKSYNFFEQLFLNQMPYCILLSKHIWSKVGKYDETMVDGYEDWEFNIRLGINGYYGIVVQKPLFHYNVSSNGMLISNSLKKHGILWGKIQKKHFKTYHFFSLIDLWKKWRKRPSRYPLVLYFFWRAIYKILPTKIFNFIFKFLLNFSHSRNLKS